MKLKGLRWWIVGLVGLATVINYIDRNALAVMWPGISEDLGMTKDDYAMIISVFMVAYAIGQSLFGKIFDAIGTRISFVFSILIWSVSIACHSLARGVFGFSAARFGLGFGEAGNWPGATKSNAEWFPINERALAQGIFNSGASLGAVISAPLIAVMYEGIGWRSTFLLVAGLGLLWIIPWLIINKKGPKEHPWLSDEEKNYILEGQKLEAFDEEHADSETSEEEEVVPTWGQLLAYKESWAVIISRFFLDPVWWLFVSWLPIYLAEQFGFQVKEIGLFAWVPYVGAALGSLLGGWLSGYWIRKGWSVNRARKTSIVIGGALMLPSLLLTSVASTPTLAVSLIAVILFGFQISIGNIQTLPSDYFSGKTVGSLAGLGGTAAVVGVLITIQLVPIITESSYVPFFILGALLVPFGILAIFLGGKIEPVSRKQNKSITQQV
ncbi:MAG: MFS transporter [Bacteroidia bacterium]|nr:MFS transporter [Bacteroidia bacterium]